MNDEKMLWVIEYCGPRVPAPQYWPDIDDDIVVVADQMYVVVETTYDDACRIVVGYPYIKMSGHPADGRWINECGDDVYIHDATLLSSERELWTALGLTPEEFGAESWDDVDDDVVRDHVPSF